MGCGCGKSSSEIKFRLVQADRTHETFDTRDEAAEVQRSHGGKIRPIRVPSGQDADRTSVPPRPQLPDRTPTSTR